MKQIVPGFYQLTWPLGINMYFIEDPDGLTLVDASLESATAPILKAIHKLGRKPADLKRILITHAHLDHVGSLPALTQATGAEVIASEIEKPVIQGEVSISRGQTVRAPMDLTFKPTPVSRIVGDCDMLPEVMGGMRALFTPGHAPGHMAFWQPEKRVLIAGDVLFNLIGLTLPPGFLTADMSQNRRSVARLADLDPSVLCLGHGPVITKDTAQKLRAVARKVAPA